MIQIKKVLNSSVVLVEKDGREIVALGRGIGYAKKRGDYISNEEIDKVFLSLDSFKPSRFAELINEIPIEFFEMTKIIVHLAENSSLGHLNNNIYLTLSDHLNFAVERVEKGLKVTNRLKWEIENYYPKEFQVGVMAVKEINEKYKYKLPEEEAANIAFHIINAQTKDVTEVNGLQKAKLIGNIVNIIRYSLKHPLDTDSIHYARFITHIRYFVDRFFDDALICEEKDGLYHQMLSLYPIAMEIASKVKIYVDKTYQTEIPENEIAYLGVHINRLMNYSSME